MNCDAKILEGIVTTSNPDGAANISPMGPKVCESIDQLLLRPFPSSTTFQNLKRTREGVFHISDDVDLLARAAVGRLDPAPQMLPPTPVARHVLADCCRWFAFRVDSIDESGKRMEVVAHVVDRGSIREFFGFNRAKHAVVEAAILATRVQLLPHEEILVELKRLAVVIKKTAGAQERAAFAFLEDYIHTEIHKDIPENNPKNIHG